MQVFVNVSSIERSYRCELLLNLFVFYHHVCNYFGSRVVALWIARGAPPFRYGCDMACPSASDDRDVTVTESAAYARYGKQCQIKFKACRYADQVLWEVRSVLEDFNTDPKFSWKLCRIVNSQMKDV